MLKTALDETERKVPPIACGDKGNEYRRTLWPRYGLPRDLCRGMSGDALCARPK